MIVEQRDRRLPGAIIYTHFLLERSMTFIRGQGEALRRYQAVYAGARAVAGLDLPATRSHAVNQGTLFGSLREAVFRETGWSPGLLRYLAYHDPKVVHTHFGTCGPTGMALARRLGLPLIVTFHGQDATMSEREAQRTYRGRQLIRRKTDLIARTDTFIAVSEYIRSRLLEQGYPQSKTRVLRNGIDLLYFQPECDFPRDPVVLFVGRFVEKKGAGYLIRAAKILLEQRVAFELVMVGSGPLEADLRQLAAELGVPVRFTGFLPQDEIRGWLERARVVAVPSITAADGDSEGLPTILLEAQAMKTPVVATRHSGIPEGVVAGKTAELVPERDATSLAHGLRAFLESPNKSHEFGEAARRFVATHFDMRTQVGELEDLYDELRQRYVRSFHRRV